MSELTIRGTNMILITINSFNLIKVVETKYFKNGKANLHCKVSYHVEYQDYGTNHPQCLLNRYWFSSMVKAIRYLKIVSNPNLDALQRSNAIDHFNNILRR